MLASPGPPEAVEVLESGLRDNAGAEHAAAAWVSVRWQPPTALPTTAPAVSYELVAQPVSELAEGVIGNGNVGGASAVAATALVVPGAVKMTVPARGGVTECRLESLLPGTSYAVRLRAVGAEGAGHSGWSHDATLTTPGQRLQADAEALGSVSAAGGVAVGGGRGGKGKGKGGAAAITQRRPAVAPATSVSGDSEDYSSSLALAFPAPAAAAGAKAGGGKTGKAAKAKKATPVAVAAAPAAAARAPPARRSLLKLLKSKHVVYWLKVVLVRAALLVFLRLIVLNGGKIR
jgi:hypothetical protein